MNIELTQEQVEAFNRGESITITNRSESITITPKPKQWEPRGGGFWVTGYSQHSNTSSENETREFGVERQTKKAAEKASDAMRTHNRLLAYVDEFGGDWEANWENSENIVCVMAASARYGSGMITERSTQSALYICLKTVQKI